jgi:hypothetical protein
MKKPYLYKLKEICGFSVWIVDGNYIRNNLEKDFTNYAQHYKFKIVPKNEFWIDDGASRAEDKFYILSMLVMNRLMARRYSHRKAIEIADKIEKRERKKYLIEKKKIKFPKTKEASLNLVHKKLIKKYNFGKCKVWIVNGEVVRDLFFLDFTEGGHDKVYSFIPKNEIWIDDDLKAKERKFVLLHEVYERNLMAKGMKYDPAHERALIIEYFCRNHPKEINENLKKEFEKFKIF